MMEILSMYEYIKHIKNEYNQDNIKFIGYIDDDFNIVINE